jgi:hypothetical protein
MISPESLDTNVSLTLLTTKLQTEIILGTYTVRVHTRIGREPCARLWYLCRALDKDGSGHLTLPLPVVQTFLDCSDKSVYRWLQDGKKIGAFRRYKIKAGMITVYLGGMFQVCYNLNLKRWGDVAVVPLAQVLSDLRSLTTGIVTQSFQQKSRYAANRQLKPEYRKLFGAPHPNELVKDTKQSSLKSPEGEVPCVLHTSSSRIFVSKSFIHYGTSQKAVSCELGIHKRTVRRHQKQLGMNRRQLCQAKIEYNQLRHARNNDASEFWAFTGTKTDIGYQVMGDAIVFSDGIAPGAKKRQPNTYQIDATEFDGRLFKVGDKVFMNRCNIYREQFTLTTMSAARRKYHFQLSQCHFSENRAGRVGNRFVIGCHSGEI